MEIYLRTYEKKTCTKVVCEVRPPKEDPNMMRITIGGNRIIYPGDLETPTASLELIKIIINSVPSRHGAKFACIDVNVYLATPTDRSEYEKIKISKFIENIICKPLLIMYGCILKFSGGAMAYPKVVSHPTIECAHASTNHGTLRLQQPQGYGNTPGVPSNFD